MSDQKIIAVVGATGAQGGGLVRAILEDPSGGFAVRAITRDPTTAAARELERLGAQIVAADVNDAASLERAFAGAYGAYCVTFFWADFSPQKEMLQAGNMARAARHAGLSHVIWSTLEDTRIRVPLESQRMPTLMGNFKVPHFDAKGASDRLFTDAGVPTTLLLASFYWDNLIHFGLGPKKDADGVLAIAMPMGNARLPGIAAEDIGRCAYGIFKGGHQWVGKKVGVAGELLTGRQMAESLGSALGQQVRYGDVAPDVYRASGFPGADELGNMFQYKRDFEPEFCAVRDPAVARSLNARLQTFDAWLANNVATIQLL